MVLIRQQRRDAVAVAQAKAECRLYNRLFTKADPKDVRPVTSPGESPVGTADPAVRIGFVANINPHSLEVVTAKCEPSFKAAKPELRYQFERLAYFAIDADSQPGKLVLNRTITLKDTWAKEVKKQ